MTAGWRGDERNFRMNEIISQHFDRCVSAVDSYTHEDVTSLNTLEYQGTSQLLYKPEVECVIRLPNAGDTSTTPRQQNVEVMANQILSQFRTKLGSRLVSISDRPNTIMTIQDQNAFKFSISFETHIWEGNIDYPERWLVGLVGVPVMLKPSPNCNRNFRIRVYSDLRKSKNPLVVDILLLVCKHF
ncbi:hypothetical protein PHET_05546 [Paragonimus heterotremus]|uniref:Uncharacterized protein n=1 Tax=Paragonimus heterotremus TaxID=100268 RepID=A0A8J4THA7_9TREM|nr:hypothetical protein PHET_05546 [Paragonimus heterotremus]